MDRYGICGTCFPVLCASATQANREFQLTTSQTSTFQTPNFWVIARAVSDFYEKHGTLPFSGSLPDMKSKSADYIELQNVFRSKARADAENVVELTEVIEKAYCGRQTCSIDVKEIETYCKSAGYVKLVRGRRPHLIKPGSLVAWDDRAKYACTWFLR